MSAEIAITTDTPLPVSPTASVAASVAASAKKEEEPRLKKIHKWSREQEVLISEWSDLAMCYRWLHDKSEKFFHSKNRWINIPVIILSGNDESKDKIKCFEMGADDYVSKPFNPKEIIARVNRRLDARDKLLQRIGI